MLLQINVFNSFGGFSMRVALILFDIVYFFELDLIDLIDLIDFITASMPDKRVI